MVHSSSNSGIFFEEDEQPQALRNSHLAPQNMCSNMVPVSGEAANASSGPGSLVTDANTESYTRFPASPLSFNSNSINISGSTIIDNSSPVQHHGVHQGASTATSLPNFFVSDQDNVSNLRKKPRLDISQEDILQQQTLRQMFQRQDSIQLQTPNQPYQALYQHQQLLQALPPVRRAQLIQQLNSRQNSPQPGLQPAVNRPYDGGVCARRLMQYLFHQRHKPTDINYWRKFVAEYYSPRAKQRWCLSLHNNVGHHPSGVFPPANTDVWQCSICGSKLGRGFEAAFEILPRLNEIKFGSVINELWSLDLPRECRFSSGVMILEYGKAIQESVYEQLRVVHEGRLKVVFTPDLKILSWEFCSRRHQELYPRRLVAPQVNQMLEVAQKWQSTLAESGSGGVSHQDLQTSSNMFVTAGRQLARSLDTQSFNDLGFTKRYVRSLQIAEVVTSLKDLMDFTKQTNAGPIDALKRFPRGKMQMQKMQGMKQMSSGIQFHPPDRSQVALHQTGSMNNTLHMGNYQNTLMRQQAGQALQSNNIPPPIGYQRCPSGTTIQVQHNHNQNNHNHMIQQVLVKSMNDNNNNGGGGAKPSTSSSQQTDFSPADGESDVFQDLANEYFNNDQPEDDGSLFGWKV